MSNRCRFTVIISAYNVEAYNERAINSVLNQNFTDYELIVVEDKSTDNTLEKIMKFDGKVRIIKNPVNKGLGAVRNIGIENAVGEYIVHLDGDDTLYNETTLTDIDKTIGDKKPDIVFFGFQEINGNNRLRVATKENSTKEARLMCDATFSITSKSWARRIFIEKNQRI